MQDSPQEVATRKARWISAIDGEIRELGDHILGKTMTAEPPVAAGDAPDAEPRGPGIIVKQSPGRFRLPRRVKQDLIRRFIAGDRGAPTQLTTLIIVAHPDDESIGAGARLRKLGDAWVVDVTDGAPRDIACANRHG
ncbi:MAG TPA: hypothetical protein VEB19_04755, partial [Gemmatimonadaceae bacterium]|nr:hypothetical protein [Gemmatimonadaceae bacterium]